MCRSEQLPASPRRGEQHLSRLPLPTLYQLTEIIEARSSSWQVGIAMLRGMLGTEGEKASGAGSRSIHGYVLGPTDHLTSAGV